jgi:hypothetical protein
MFEPVSLEVSYEEPVYGEPGEDGVAPIVEYVSKTRLEPASLDFDEFVAGMWLKGVKFGIDEKPVRRVIASGETVRMEVAHYLEPTEGRDAEIMEVSNHLHRDDAPKILANGRTDLRMFKNRFPQMSKGERLIKKVPRELGKQGRYVTGEAIEPRMPDDMDMSTLTALGVSVEQGSDGEYIVAILDGFLVLDEHSNKMSVVEKIENQGGISARTTGDLDLDVNEFIEHGEVQEGREVKGKNMTFMADVYGSVVSESGNIRIDGNLTGGRAETLGGNITTGARVSRAVVVARAGEVTAKFCESSTIMGKVVHVEHAVNCELIADELHADVIEGCMVAARNIRIVSADERRGKETLVTALIPDFSGFDQYVATQKKDIVEAQVSIEDRTREISQLKSAPELARYLVLDEKIKSGEIFLTDEQARNWQKLVMKQAKAVNQMAQLEQEIAELRLTIGEAEQEISASLTEREAMGEGIACVIEKIAGQTIVQTMKSRNGMMMFGGLQGVDIRSLLLKVDSNKARVFSGDAGAIDWKFQDASKKDAS